MATWEKNTKHQSIYYSGCNEDRHRNGVEFAVSEKLTECVILVEAVNEQKY